MKKTLPIISILLTFVVIASSLCYANLKSEHEWLQKNIDQNFQHEFSMLISDLMTIHLNPDMSEEEYQFYNEKVTKSGYLAKTLVSMSSYRENAKLSLLVGMIDQASGTDAINSIDMNEELDKKLKDVLASHLSDENLISEACELVKKSITKNN